MTQDAIKYDADVELDRPVMIAAFRGWNDAGDAATFAAEHLARVWSAERIARIDPEEFFDFQSVRPTVHLVEGSTRHISWPTNEFWAAHLPGAPHDVVLLVGTEPNLRWRGFSDLVVGVARRLEVSLVVTFGALLADVPHSRPVQITGTAVDPDLVRRLGLHRSRYEGPTGIVGVLHDALSRAGVDSASLWAAVPHYLGVAPNPKAALALVETVTGLIGVGADVGELARATLDYEEQVAQIVATDDDVQAYVRLLEERIDERALEEIAEADLPSGESLAQDIERFLRERGDDK
jgi:proteasome assembly chaperone (PAC2) family protein